MTAINRFTVLPSAARTTSGTGNLDAFTQDFDELILYVSRRCERKDLCRL